MSLTHEQKLHDVVEVSQFQEVLEALRSKHSRAWVGENPSPIRGGTMQALNDNRHTKRRRTLNRILDHDGLRWYHDHVLVPLIGRRVDEILANPDRDGHPRADMVAVGKRIQVQLVAATGGFERAREDDGLDDLMKLYVHLRDLNRVDYLTGDPSEIIRCGLEAKAEFIERFFAPSLKAHRELARKRAAGEIDDADLPRDILMLIAGGADPHWDEEPDMAVREALNATVIGGTEATTNALAWSIEDLSRWLAKHPEDFHLRTDSEFLLGAVTETLRLHGAGEVLIRQAGDDVTFAEGTHACAGDMIMLRTVEASQDKSVFGPDADQFNPCREIPKGVYPWGLAFASGPHMCYGLPLVMGGKGVDGSLVHLLKTLYGAGMEKDPDRPATLQPPGDRDPRFYYDKFATYPVRFPKA